MKRTSRAASAGFTLLEILIAFAIATTTVGLLLRIHANSTTTVVLSEEYQTATVLAQTLLAELPVTERSLEFMRTGSSGKYGWEVRASALSEAPTGDTPYRLRSIAAEVAWSSRDRERRIELRTVRPFYGREP